MYTKSEKVELISQFKDSIFNLRISHMIVIRRYEDKKMIFYSVKKHEDSREVYQRVVTEIFKVNGKHIILGVISFSIPIEGQLKTGKFWNFK